MSDPNLSYGFWQVLGLAISSVLGLVGWLGRMTYNRLSERISGNAENIRDVDQRLRDMPSREDVQNLRNDIRDLRQHIDSLWQRGNEK